jgi:DNA-binding GntR family transcriptional regulator
MDIKVKLNRETLVDRIVDILENRILKGELRPRTKLSEIHVANEFGVSRVPAREALQRLEEMNLVRKNHLGREVAEFSREEYAQIHELKDAVEAFGVMKGALKASPQHLARIQSVMQRMERYASDGDLARMKRCNYEFHDLLVSCCGNQKLFNTYLSLVKQVRWATTLSLQLPTRLKEAFREHQKIFEAFRRKDGMAARAFIEAHSQESMKRVLSQMESMEKGRGEGKKRPEERNPRS